MLVSGSASRSIVLVVQVRVSVADMFEPGCIDVEIIIGGLLSMVMLALLLVPFAIPSLGVTMHVQVCPLLVAVLGREAFTYDVSIVP